MTVSRLPDRSLLEDSILPWFAGRRGFRRSLLVGCDRRSAGYPALLGGDCRTLDRKAGAARWGSRGHVRGDARELGSLFAAGSLDLILLNGLLGYGVDDAGDAERIYAGCRRVLRRGGALIVGWNRFPGLAPLFPDASRELRAFAPWRFPVLGSRRLAVEYGLRAALPGGGETRLRRWNHTYDFYRKR